MSIHGNFYDHINIDKSIVQRYIIAMLRKMYNWMMSYAGKPSAPWALSIISFCESSFFPLPPDPLLIPMILANKKKAYYYAFLCTITSVFGGFLGYAIGALFFDTIGQWLINIYGMAENINEFNLRFNEWGFLIIAIKGFTPIPFKVVTIASGFAHYDLLYFTLASIFARGIRFFATAFLLVRYGEAVQHRLEKNLGVSLLILLGIIIFGFWLLKYV